MQIEGCSITVDDMAKTTTIAFPDGRLAFLIGCLPDQDKPISLLFDKRLELRNAMLTVEKIRAEIVIDELNEEISKLKQHLKGVEIKNGR